MVFKKFVGHWRAYRKADTLDGSDPLDMTVPPVPDLLVSNRPPTDFEAELIRRLVATVRIEIERHFLGSNSNAHTHIGVYKEFIRSQSTLLFRRSPPVILQTVFLFFMEEEDEKPLSKKLPSSWVLGHVCSQWRAIALATPNLWGRFPPIHLGTLKKRDVDRIYACLSTLLDRCSGVPISFFLHNEVAIPLEYPIIDLLIAHCGQWGNVSLEVSGTTIQRFSKIEGHLSSLHSLEFSLCGRGEPVLKLFESAPRLRKVYVNSLVSCGMLRLPWTQLTSYRDTTSFVDGFPRAFHLGSSLQHLTFRRNRNDRPIYSPQIVWEPITVPNLTTLKIEFLGSMNGYKIETLFDNLTLPALHTLVLRFYKDEEVVDTQLINMIGRSLCDIKHLTFHGHDSPINVFLVVMPSLTTLDINDPSSEIIKTLCSLQGGEWTTGCCLQSLTIHLSKFIDIETSYLVELSRLASIRCDTYSAFRDDYPSLTMIKTFKVAVHGKEDRLSHFYYASLEPPTTEMEKRSAQEIAELYKFLERPILPLPSAQYSTLEYSGSETALPRNIWTDHVISCLKNLIDSDDQAVVGIYLSGIDYQLYRALKELPLDNKCNEVTAFNSEVAKWGLKLSETVPMSVKWDWDDHNCLAYVPYEDRQQPRAATIFKSQRPVYRNVPPAHSDIPPAHHNVPPAQHHVPPAQHRQFSSHAHRSTVGTLFSPKPLK